MPRSSLLINTAYYQQVAGPAALRCVSTPHCDHQPPLQGGRAQEKAWEISSPSY